MRGYIQPGKTITLPAPYAVASGDGLLVGAIFGIATGSAALSAEVEALTEGVVELRKAPSQAWALGIRVYWDNAARLATTVVASNTLIGAAIEPVAGGVNDTIGRVRLNGSF
jgi:predicted RecA/RadA family phage recombinase